LGDSNLASDGWVFEAEFFYQHKRATKKNEVLTLSGNPNIKIKPCPVDSFDHCAFLEMTLLLNISHVSTSGRKEFVISWNSS
jgi:hypothetical protein